MADLGTDAFEQEFTLTLLQNEEENGVSEGYQTIIYNDSDKSKNRNCK